MIQTNSLKTSIVIRAFNEERWLPEVLRAIESQTYRNFEVLVVDSGSIDRTREIAASFGARIIRLRQEDFTFGHSLNLGIAEARGSLIAILSAHAIPTDQNWLIRLVAPFQQENVAMVFGGQRGHAISKFSEARDLERVFPGEPQEMDDEHVFVNNANSAIRRELWLQHPFDEGLPGLEDAEWAKYWIHPHGKSVLYEPSACVFHVHTESWAQVRHRFYREGIAGRWTAVRIMRHIPGEIWRELRWTAMDLAIALGRGRLHSLASEIVRYRYQKTVGIVTGILDSRRITNPSQRAQIQTDTGFSAVVVRGPRSAGIESRGLPSLKPAEVMVRVAYEGICATDLELFEGRLGYYKDGMGKYPIVPGHEVSGTVVALGKKDTGLSEGDRVVVECIQGCGTCSECKRDNAVACSERSELGVIGLDGGYGEYLVTRARYVHKIPGDLTLAEAALVEPLAVVNKALRRVELSEPGGVAIRCGVIGAGTIGHLAANLLAARNHHVVVFDRNLARLSSLSKFETHPSLENLDGFDLIIEATGNQMALNTALQRSATGARLLLLGLPYAHHSFNFESLVAFDKSVIGSVGSSARDFKEALVALPSLDTSSLLSCRFPLQEYERAWEAVRSGAHLKVMLQVDANAQ